MKLRYLSAALVALALTSCKKDILTFKDEVAHLQFGPTPDKIYTPAFDLADTLKKYTFFYKGTNITQDTVYFDIYAIGGVRSVDRPFTLIQEDVPGANNAVAGVHYKTFNDPTVQGKYVIKAGQVHTSVPIVLLRDASLKTSDITLKFKIQENENFKYGEAACLWRKLIFTDRLSKPAIWDTYKNSYLGEYSVVKQNFMIQVTGQPWDQDWIVKTINDFSTWTYYIAVCKTAWIDYNNAHSTDKLKDENGVQIVFP